MVIVVVAIGDAVGDQADHCDSDEGGGRVDRVVRTPLGIVGGGATDAHAEEETGENETIEMLFHAHL